jgi:hypothetical protein
MGYGWILFASELDPGLNLPDGHAGEMETGVVDALKPSQHSAMGSRPAQFSHHIGVEQESHRLQLHYRPAAGASTRRNKVVHTGLRSKQELLKAGPRGSLQALPLLNRHQHCCFSAAPRHHLGTFALTRIEQLTEARLGVLDRPHRHDTLIDWLPD